MDFDQFVKSVSGLPVALPRLRVDSVGTRVPEDVDAIFQLPLLALVIMILARREPFSASALGRDVSALLVERFATLGRSRPNLEVSITLRRRCAEALVFLEIAELVEISRDSRHIVSLTPGGKTRCDRVRLKDSSDLGVLVRTLTRALDRLVARRGVADA